MWYEAIFFRSIFGIASIGALAFGVIWVLGRLLNRQLHPGAWALAVGLLALVTLPSVPRYQFEQQVRAAVDGWPGSVVVTETRWGDLAEPLTWFSAPVGHFRVIYPDARVSNWFHEVVFRYDEGQPLRFLIEVDCENDTSSISVPDSSGVLRIPPGEERINDEDRVLLCEKDWSDEREEILKAILDKGD